jgi:hypothetical protein
VPAKVRVRGRAFLVGPSDPWGRLRLREGDVNEGGAGDASRGVGTLRARAAAMVGGEQIAAAAWARAIRPAPAGGEGHPWGGSRGSGHRGSSGGGPYSKDPGRGVNPAWHGRLTGVGVEWHTARPSGAMPRPPEPVDRVDTAPGGSLAVGRLLPPGQRRLRRLMERLDAAATGAPRRDIARAAALLEALLPRRGP